MRSKHYAWWGYVKEIIRAYPALVEKDFYDDSTLNRIDVLAIKAVETAIDDARGKEAGKDIINLIRLVHWDRTHTIDGAALEIHCSRRTALRMQRNFFETVARNRNLLD